MALVINTNIASINAQRGLAGTENKLKVAMERLSSGLRVNSAKDDAAGLAVAAGMMNQARGMDVAIRNANDGLSLLQVADGALSSMGDIMMRMRELAVQSLNGTYSDTDRAKLDAEYTELESELTRMQTNVKFNGTALFGASAVTLKLQVGANSGETIDITTTGVNVSGLGGVNTSIAAGSALTALDTAIDSVNTERAKYGASMSRLDNVIVNLRTGYEAQMASYSRIMDADFARETANLSKAQILQQAGIAMVAQANQSQVGAIALLQG